MHFAVTLDKADQPPWLAGLDRSVPSKNGVGNFLEFVASLNKTIGCHRLRDTQTRSKHGVGDGEADNGSTSICR